MKDRHVEYQTGENNHRLRLAYIFGRKDQIEAVQNRNRRELAKAEARDYKELRR